MFRIIALLAAYNEELYMSACLEHLDAHGVHAYLIDNESTDRTVEIAKQFLKRNLIGIETFPRNGMFRYRALLERKQELAQELDANWFLQHDVDEIRVPPRAGETLAQAFARVQAEGSMPFSLTNTFSFPRANFQITRSPRSKKRCGIIIRCARAPFIV